ncbi:MAG: tetratricopeptide repeat protein [Cyanobacteria bacterium P01_E01_bin.42]
MNQEGNNTNTEEYLHFLEEVMQAVSENWNDSTPVHAILRENLDKLDFQFAEILQTWATEKIEKATRFQAESIAINLRNFSIDLFDFPLGNRANNIEIAIICLEIRSQVFTRENSPERWANTQESFGNYYSNRIKGEKKENLENAISCYQTALQIHTRDAFPQDWANIQGNLGNAYQDRIKGEKKENLENAIACYQDTLQVCTRDAFPQYWANTQKSLGIAYRNRIKGEKKENLENAIACFQAALQIHTRDVFPQDWARTQIGLGIAYFYRIQGERNKNLEKTIVAFQAASQVLTHEAFPQDWAMLQHNLGEAYIERIRGERGKNLEEAIAILKTALEVRTRDAFPENWAMTKDNLGVAYLNRIQGEREDNLETAINYHQQALEIFTRESFPENFAQAQTNLGTAFKAQFDELGNLEDLTRAITAYKQAVSIYQDGAYGSEPLAQVLYRLGFALMQQGSYSQAISTLERARVLQSQRKDIIGLATTLFTLAGVYHRTNYFQEARLYFKESLRLFRRLQEPKKIAAVLTSLGNVEMQLLRFDCARDHLEEARTYYDSHNNAPRLAEVNKLLNWIEEELENVNSQSLQSDPAKVGS